jgi:hypothetical protein
MDASRSSKIGLIAIHGPGWGALLLTIQLMASHEEKAHVFLDETAFLPGTIERGYFS